RPADLLIRVRHDAPENGIFCVETGIPEVPGQGARVAVRPALRHGINLNARGSSLSGVESAADQLELGDGVAAEMRTAHPHDAPVRGHLMSVQIDLKTAWLIAVRRIRTVRSDRRRASPVHASA